MEKQWAPASTKLTATGTSRGLATVASTAGFYVKQKVALGASSVLNTKYQVQRVLSPTQMIIGPTGENINVGADISAFGSGTAVNAGQQNRSNVPLQQISRYVYAEEPACALRNLLVDPWGNNFSAGNGLRITEAGKTVVETLRHVYDNSTNKVANGVWSELVASMPAAASEIEIFDSSGQTLLIGLGPTGSEGTLGELIVVPGGNGKVPFSIPAGAQVSIQGLSGDAIKGELDINFYG